MSHQEEFEELSAFEQLRVENARLKAENERLLRHMGKIAGFFEQRGDLGNKVSRAFQIARIYAEACKALRPRRVRHLKRGSTYEVVGEAEMQVSEPTNHDIHQVGFRLLREGDLIAVYRAEDGKLYGRFPDEFGDGRFEELP